MNKGCSAEKLRAEALKCLLSEKEGDMALVCVLSWNGIRCGEVSSNGESVMSIGSLAPCCMSVSVFVTAFGGCVTTPYE